jgi:hypothetical protein
MTDLSTTKTEKPKSIDDVIAKLRTDPELPALQSDARAYRNEAISSSNPNSPRLNPSLNEEQRQIKYPEEIECGRTHYHDSLSKMVDADRKVEGKYKNALKSAGLEQNPENLHQIKDAFRPKPEEKKKTTSAEKAADDPRVKALAANLPSQAATNGNNLPLPGGSTSYASPNTTTGMPNNSHTLTA